MSRRKQARPIRVLEPEDGLQPGGTADPAEPGTSILGAISESSCSASDEEGGSSEAMQDADPNSERTCRRCKVDFTNLAAYLAHKPTCVKLVEVEDQAASSGEEAEDEKRDGGEVLKRRRLQDAENNNGADTAPGKEDMEEFEDSSKLANAMGLAPLLNLSPGGAPPNPATAAALASLAGGIPGASGLFSNSVTLEALQNTKVAVAQFAATALANSANNPAALQELAVLQSTLYTLQHQQMLQMNLIQQLQQQLTLNRDSKEGSPVSPASIPRTQQDDILTPPSPPISIPSSLPLSSANLPLHTASYHRERERERAIEKERMMQPSPSSQGTALPATVHNKSVSSGPRLSLSESLLSKPSLKDSPRVPTPPTTSAPSCISSVSNSILPPHPLHHQTGGVTGCSISASLAASIITNTDPHPSLDEPNSLEMLQRRAQEVLDSASQGLLAGNLADELAFRGNGGSKGKNGDGKRGNEPFFKHRCRYCGKVFGSDSALQIHIRSHTGERPFKCNVCGSRFTTKGNLKVHFQRHTSKFPHIKMNPNPIPEHLDKYHPPLLAQLQHNNPSSSSPPLIPSHPIIGSSLPPFRPSQPPSHPPSIPIPSSHHFRANSHPLLNNTTLVAPANLQIPPNAPSAIPTSQQQHLPLSMHHHMKRELYQPEQDVPENLSKPAPRPSSNTSSASPPLHARVKAEAVYSDDEAAYEEMEDKRSSSGHHDDILTSPSPLNTSHNDRPSSNPFPDQDEMSVGGGSSSRAGDFSEEDAAGGCSPAPIVDVDESSQKSMHTHLAMRHELPENLSKNPKPNSQTNISSRNNVENKSSNNSFLLSNIENGHLLINHSSNNNAASSSSSNNTIVPFSGAVSPSLSSTTSVSPAQKDPVVLASLLSCPASYDNDNSWESFIEIDKTSETSKLQQLVDNIEYKLTDPNQCIVCHRVLSCKSALQMHYRTHTGERPYRCRICGRAFTTKGNLKTHMSVHRTRPPLRSAHQCPVCHRNFSNALVLQQHIRLHTGEPTELTPEQIQAAEIRDYPVAPPPPFFVSPQYPYASSFPPPPPSSFLESYGQTESSSVNSSRNDGASDCEKEDDEEEVEHLVAHPSLTDESSPLPSPALARSCGSPSESNSLGALDLTPKIGGQTIVASPPTVVSSSAPSSVTPSALFASPPAQSLPSHLANGNNYPHISAASAAAILARLPPIVAHGPAVRGNTTCNICFKTFACNSALEIHYRSHTKERPFKCTICDRGFSTKGNMKQHMLTHKIRDMPQHLFDTKKPSSRVESLLGGSMHPHQPPHHHALLAQPPPPLHLSMPPMMSCSNSNSSDGIEDKGASTPEPHRSPDLGLKRSPPEDDLPMAKRPSGLHKHLCHVCNKNFSSSSALQIHMRTHTGDKPFKCTVCQKAFTTKGNLKVHMGTHMWNNGASRRGRRMSLDLPPIPMTPKDSEFLQRRPDLFYPYLPAPFLNGMQQKLNEISVIQSSTPPGGLPSPPSRYGHGPQHPFPGLGMDKPMGMTVADISRSPSPDDKSSPLSLVRHSSPPSAAAWDMHYRRLSPANGGAASPPSAQQGMMSLSPSPPPASSAAQNAASEQHRGESLVA